MKKKKVNCGEKYGLLDVIEYSGVDIHHNSKYICRCKCGNFVEVRGANLRSGKTTSCGCKRKNPYRKEAHIEEIEN